MCGCVDPHLVTFSGSFQQQCQRCCAAVCVPVGVCIGLGVCERHAKHVEPRPPLTASCSFCLSPFFYLFI